MNLLAGIRHLSQLNPVRIITRSFLNRLHILILGLSLSHLLYGLPSDRFPRDSPASILIQRLVKAVSTPSYSGSPGLYSRARGWLSCLRFSIGFLCFSRRILGWYHEAGHSCFLSNPSQFTFILPLDAIRIQSMQLRNH